MDVMTADTEEEDQVWNTMWLRGGDGAGAGGRRRPPRGPW
jgi:hypothetical protein